MHVIALRFTLASLALVGTLLVCADDDTDSRPTDPKSGLKLDTEDNWMLVIAHCGSCHSGRLLAQHSLDREGWLKTIRRMQSDENLWDLGDSEVLILDYLESNYGNDEDRSTQPVRRAPLNQEPIEQDDEMEKDEVSIDENDSNSDVEGTTPITSDEK